MPRPTLVLLLLATATAAMAMATTTACNTSDERALDQPLPPVRPTFPPDTTLPNDIEIANKTTQTITVRIIFHSDGALIDQMMLLRPDPYRSINLDLLTPIDQAPAIDIPPNEARILPTGSFKEVNFDSGAKDPTRATQSTPITPITPITRVTRGVAFDINGHRSLLVGNGTANFQQRGIATSLEMVSESLHPVAIIPRSTLAPPLACNGRRHANLTLPKKIDPELFGKQFRVSTPKLLPREDHVVSDPECYELTATPIDTGTSDTTQTLTFRVCNGGDAFWSSFKDTDILTLERPKLIEGARLNGMRFTRPSDGRAIELAHVVEHESRIFHQMAPATTGGHGVVATDVRQENGCFIPNEGCSMESIHTTLPLESKETFPFMAGGRIYLLGARRSLYALNCAADFGVTFDVVVVDALVP